MKPSNGRRLHKFTTISWRDLAASFGPILVAGALAVWLTIRFIQPASPHTLTITAGPPGSTFWNAAMRYQTILARNGVKLKVLTSEGAIENLQRLADPAAHVDVGFVQSGLQASGATRHIKGNTDNLVSLGSIAYVPLAIFYTGKPVARLAEFHGKRLAIGPEGSGTRQLALTLLKANGIQPGGTTTLLPLAGNPAAKALESGQIDAAFLTGDSAQPPVMAALTRMPGIRFYSFTQAPAYTRHFPYLTQIDLPMGSFDLGKNLPPQTLSTLAPSIDLIARDSLHPALSDLLIEAARQVHGRANLLQHAGEFPAPIAHDFPLSDDAARYYKSGKSFLYRVLPFWLASLADRLLVVLVPIIVVLIPGLRLVPWLYAWRVRSRIYRWYGALIAIERTTLAQTPAQEHADLLAKLDAIEMAVNRLKMPLAYADQFYVLREHIGFVRSRLTSRQHPADEPGAVDGAKGTS